MASDIDELDDYRPRLELLTDRQLEILDLVCQGGKTRKDIGAQLHITERTVLFHVSEAYERLGISELSKPVRQRLLWQLAELVRAEKIARFEQASATLPATNTDTTVLSADTSVDEVPMNYLVPLSAVQAVIEDEPEPAPLVRLSAPAPLAVRQEVPSPPHTTPPLHTLWTLPLFVGMLLGISLVAIGYWGYAAWGTDWALSLTEPPTPPSDGTVLATQTIAAPPENTTDDTSFAALSQEQPTCLPPVVAVADETRFLPSEGVSHFTVENTKGAVRSDKVRNLAIDTRGLWIGYFPDESHSAGVGMYNKQEWTGCAFPTLAEPPDVNAVAIAPDGRVWVGTERNGLFVQDQEGWRQITTVDGLPSDEIYGLTIDAEGNVWASTWEGIAKYDGERWSTPYNAENRTIFSDHTHAIAFTDNGQIWVGHITEGVSFCCSEDGDWVHYTAEEGNLGGNEVRSLLVRDEPDGAQSLWIGTQDGGVTRVVNGEWTTFTVADGLPDGGAQDFALDRYGRVWVATDGGVAYYDGSRWQVYHHLPALTVAIGPTCSECPFDDDHVWTGTVDQGLTHSRLPLPEPVVDVTEICFESDTRDRLCPNLEVSPSGDIVTATYPITLTANETIIPRISIAPRPPHQLQQARGDMLVNVDTRDASAVGAFRHISVEGTIESGQPNTFVDRDNPLHGPSPTRGATTYTVSWRTWYYTRFVGPVIRVRFMVAGDG